MTSRGIIVFCCCLVVPGLANPMMAREAESEVDRFEARLASIMDSLNQKDTIGLYGNMVTLERVAVEEQRSTTEETEDDPLMRRIDDFLRSHKLQISFPSDGSSADLFGRALGEKNVGFELRGLIQGASEGKIDKILDYAPYDLHVLISCCSHSSLSIKFKFKTGLMTHDFTLKFTYKHSSEI